MTLSDISIKNPVFAWMLMLALMVFGWIGFSRMGVSAMPDVDFPIVTVAVSWEGAAPEIMESEVVDVIEDALTSIQGVREISSTARQGAATITVEFELERGIDVALQEVQTKIAQAQMRLPKEMDPPVVTKVNPEDNPIMWLALSGTVPVKDIMVYAEDVLKNRFQTIPGVGDIFLGGLIPRSLRVWLDADKMARMEITVEDVLAAIRREHVELPAGQIETSTKEFNVRTFGEINDPQKFGELLITQRGGQPIHVPIPLKEVARVEDGLGDLRRISRSQGERAVGLGIRKQRGANAVAVSFRVLKRLEEVKKLLPPGMTLALNFDGTRFIKDAVHELNFTLVLSALLTSLVCWAFLGSWSSTVNILMAIPTSVLGTFIVTYFLGFTLNTFTLLGLTLAIGIIVDDAIMVLENIVRHRELGQGRMQAAIFGARQITFAALAATVAILAIFLPVVFMSGIIGKFFYQFGVTISVAVLFSLLEALTLAPMRCSQFLEVGERRNLLTRLVDRGFERSAALYRRALSWCLGRRWKVIGASLLVFAASFFTVRRLRKEFVPPQDQAMFMVRLQTPVGSSMEFTDAKFKEAEAWMTRQPALKRYYSAVGGFGGGEVNAGIIFVSMKAHSERPTGAAGGPMTQGEFMALARRELNKIPDLKAIIVDFSQSGFSASRGFPVEFTVRGPDWAILTESSQKLAKRLEEGGELIDVDTDYKTGMPEVRVYPDRAKAYARGVSVSSIGTVINAMVGGVRAGYFTDKGRRYEVRLRAEPAYRLSPDDIQRFYVRNSRGETIRLSEVVRIEENPTLLSITRKDRERSIGIFANIAAGKSQAAVLATVERLAKETLPEGYHIVLSGSSQTFRESFQSLIFALLMGIFVAYMVLGAQFNSFVHPFTVLLALPFSVSGAFLGLWLTGNSLNVYSMIGLILLMGIVKKNSILLVDFTNQRRREGLEVGFALLEACPIRLRPILMTSIATVAAAIPPALALGPGAETRIPMAVAVIGGVSLSTVLTLFVVPCAYSLFSSLESHRHDRDLREAQREMEDVVLPGAL
ncbi:MAG: efflux RND transporter permease subunit [Elusimicrobia bacterium]|nr:efflux RND transporter permease subunit [Elusimicrobiota bacterium]